LKDNETGVTDELPEPSDLAHEAIDSLKTAISEIENIIDELQYE